MVDRMNLHANDGYENYESGFVGDLEGPLGDVPSLTRAQGRYMDSIQPELHSLKENYQDARSGLQEAIDNCDDPVQKLQLERQMADLDRTWKKITHHPPGQEHSLNDFKNGWENRLNNMHDAIINTQQTVQAEKAGEATPVYEAQKVGPPESSVEQLADTGGTSSSGTSSTGSTSGSGSEDWKDVDIDKMMNLMSTDPNAVMDQLQDMPLEQRGIVMNMVNQQLQQINQMIKMMSNINKSMHDTAKAAINNMRV